MTPFEAYKLYLALRMHFTQPKFDYFKYNGKVNADINSFNTRRDKFQFAKLAKHRDPQSLIVSNYLTATPKWVGDFLTDESEQHFTDWQRRKESLSYIVSQDLKKLEDDFISFFKVKDGQHPKLLTMYKQGKITIETLTILNDILHFFPIWDIRINDPIIWPNIRDKVIKYRPFLQYDRTKFKPIIKELAKGDCEAK